MTAAMREVRTATPEDIPTLLKLVEAYWAFEGIDCFDTALVSRQLNCLLTDTLLGNCWIAFVDGQPAGYLLAVYVFSLEHFGITAEIDEMFVVPERRATGIGGELLRTAESTVSRAGCTNVSLQLSKENNPARGFYRRFGYNERSRFELLEKELLKEV